MGAFCCKWIKVGALIFYVIVLLARSAVHPQSGLLAFARMICTYRIAVRMLSVEYWPVLFFKLLFCRRLYVEGGEILLYVFPIITPASCGLSH